MAERELAEEAEHEVQARGEDYEVAALPDARDKDELEAVRAAKGARDQHEERKEHNEDGSVDDVSAFLKFAHTFSPTFFPSIPAGFMISTTMRMRNTKVSERLELM